MKLQEYYELLNRNREKIPLIDKITSFHPGLGTDLGWSHYTGGMVDTGDWYIEKLLQLPAYTLERQLSIWTKEQEETKRKAEEWGKKTLEEQQEEQKAAREKWIKDWEQRLFWGK